MARNSLIFVTYNVRSLVDLSRRIELIKILNNNKVDLCFLQETHLSKDSKVNFDNYNVIRDFSSQGIKQAKVLSSILLV